MQLNPKKVSNFEKALKEYNKAYSLESLYELIKKQKR